MSDHDDRFWGLIFAILAIFTKFHNFSENGDDSIKVAFPAKNAKFTYFDSVTEVGPFLRAKTLCYSSISSLGREMSIFPPFSLKSLKILFSLNLLKIGK